MLHSRSFFASRCSAEDDEESHRASSAPTSPKISPRGQSVRETGKVVTRKLNNGTVVVNKYRILSELGRGSYGSVHLCRDEETGLVSRRTVRELLGCGGAKQHRACVPCRAVPCAHVCVALLCFGVVEECCVYYYFQMSSSPQSTVVRDHKRGSNSPGGVCSCVSVTCVPAPDRYFITRLHNQLATTLLVLIARGVCMTLR